MDFTHQTVQLEGTSYSRALSTRALDSPTNMIDMYTSGGFSTVLYYTECTV